ncbi:MAG: hypothetical protein HYZ43_04005 [Flavobacteriia bacterium]|nr:hypothetical protein [Flavobacteriia bacterium]
MKQLILFLFAGFVFLNVGCNQQKEEGFACGVKDVETVDRMKNAPIYLKKNCATCHLLDKPSTGPALQGMMKRVSGREWLKAYLKNEDSLLKIGDTTALRISKFSPVGPCHHFSDLNDRLLDELIRFTEQ